MQDRPPVELDRRTFLALIGAGAGASALGAGCAATAAGARVSWVDASGRATWTPPAMPLPTWGDGGDAASDAARFASYEVRDELVVPAGFRVEVLAAHGDRFGDVRFGANADFTALVPIEGSPDEFFLVVNHEYISPRPWLAAQAADGRGHEARWEREAPLPTLVLDGLDLPGGRFDFAAARREGREVPPALTRLCREAFADLGVSVLHVARRAHGGFEVIADSPRHARIGGERTFGNCSGGVTTWGTVLTAEENYQDHVRDAVDARGAIERRAAWGFQATGPGGGSDVPSYFFGMGEGLEPPLDGRDFGFVCEVDPARGTLRKLPRLGRLRHENAAVACRAGRALVVYEGDDRRGGHVWRYESAGTVTDPGDPANGRLLDAGTLFVARFEADGSGRWIALEPGTPLERPRPERTADGFLWAPDRRVERAGDVPTGSRVRVCVPGASREGLDPEAWIASLELTCGKPFAELTLGDLVWPSEEEPDLDAQRRRVIELEAFAMANAIGATPCGRPEDVELHPADGSLYIAFSDGTGGGDGSPDLAVLPDAAGQTSRRYGAVVRLVDDAAPEGRARTFRWSRFLTAGELGDDGGGFGCPDNLAFDPQGNLWMTSDLTTDYHNAAVDRGQGSSPGDPRFMGVFGSNALFCVPTRGPQAGRPTCFAIAPPESELTGPTFTPDGRTLLLSVQHPGEIHGTRAPDPAGTVERGLRVASRDGRLLDQRRSVPVGSNWPSGVRGTPPRSAVVCITRV